MPRPEQHVLGEQISRAVLGPRETRMGGSNDEDDSDVVSFLAVLTQGASAADAKTGKAAYDKVRKFCRGATGDEGRNGRRGSEEYDPWS